MPRLKICGLTTIADLRLAQRAGADFLGLVVETPRSPRSLSLDQAAVLARLAPGQIVAVTAAQDPELLRRLVARLRPRAVQLHGPRVLEMVAAVADLCAVWVAVGVPAAPANRAEALSAAREIMRTAAAAGAEIIVLDTAVQGETGGTGQVADWSLAAELVAEAPRPVLLAGGLGPANAAAALARVQPAGLDASSRLEWAPGRKDPAAVRAMGEAVHHRGTP